LINQREPGYWNARFRKAYMKRCKVDMGNIKVGLKAVPPQTMSDKQHRYLDTVGAGTAACREEWRV